VKLKSHIAATIIGLLTMSLPLNGYAGDELNIWAETEDIEMESNEISVEIQTDGKSTDGLLVVTYDAAALKVDETDVVWSDAVEMSSVNVVEDGILKIAYLAEKPIDKGNLATINFEVLNVSASAESLRIDGEVHDAEGNTLLVGMAKEEEIPEEDQSGEDSSKDDQVIVDTPQENVPSQDSTTGGVETPDSSSNEATYTGDEAMPLVYLVMGSIAAAAAGLLLKLRNRREY